MPVGHMEGNYYLRRGDAGDAEPGGSGGVPVCERAEGSVDAKWNVNGSLENIAGVLNEERNVLGMMPHPDRSSEALLGSADGLRLFRSMAGVVGRGGA